MAESSRPPANGIVAALRHVYNPLGFSKGYNFILFFLSIGYLFGFTLSRLEYFSFHGIFCNPNTSGGTGAAPGECYYYLRNPYKIGIQLHLYCILPASLLVCFQFVPIIRYKLLTFHRINGYFVVVLSTIASAGAIIIAPHAFGGDLATQTFVGALVISTTIAYILAWINIKRLQIDQHRAWMMRAWAYFATIITIRIIMISTANIVSGMKGFYVARPCAQIDWLFRNPEYTTQLYPECAAYFDGKNVHQYAAVKADFNSNNPNEIGASLGIGFGSAGWITLWLHAIAIELYLRLTPAESDRLREVSYHRQLERGYKHPGSAGLNASNLGDANPYIPVSQRHWQCGNAEELDTLPANKKRNSEQEA